MHERRHHISVALLGGGELEPEDLELALRHAPGLVAADGGAWRYRQGKAGVVIQ